jgi:hypothetical protein
VSETIRLCECRRNDLLLVQTIVGRESWDRVVRVDHEIGHPVTVHLADGMKVVGDASDRVSVRRLRVLSKML